MLIGKELNWFAFYCVHIGILSPSMCRDILEENDGQTDPVLFAKSVIQNNFADQELVEEYLTKAWKKAQGTIPPPRNVFSEGLPKGQKLQVNYPRPDVPTEEIDLTREQLKELISPAPPADEDEPTP